MVIFHCYVKLPEGISYEQHVTTHPLWPRFRKVHMVVKGLVGLAPGRWGSLGDFMVKKGVIGFWREDEWKRSWKGRTNWILIPKKRICHIYIYIYIHILWTYSYVWLFWYKMELRVRTNWWIDAAYGLMISHCDGSGELTWNIVVSRCFKGIKFWTF